MYGDMQRKYQHRIPPSPGSGGGSQSSNLAGPHPTSRDSKAERRSADGDQAPHLYGHLAVHSRALHDHIWAAVLVSNISR